MTSKSAAARSTLLVIGLWTAALCVKPSIAGAQKTATSMACIATFGETVAAVTNAFASHNYHNMLLSQIPCAYDPVKRRWTEKAATNEWELFSNMKPLGTLTVGGKRSPYFAHFEIRVDQIATNKCQVAVRTISSFIQNGREIGIHGGWAIHSKEVPPVLEEETNVLSRLEEQLRSIQGGNPAPLPATPDAADDLRQPVKIDLELHPEMKDQLLHAIQAETNAVLKAELLRMLMTATNAATR